MQNRGQQGEILIAELAAQRLFFDFIYERPIYHDRHILRELCDLLVILDDQAVCIEIKTREEGATKGERAEARWFGKQSAKAAHQLQGSFRTLASVEVTGINRIRNEEHFPARCLHSRHGLALFDVTEAAHEIPPELPHASKAGVPIHFFSFTDFINLVDHLRTFPDLLYYLDQRALLSPILRPKLHAEKDAYAYFLAHERSFRGVHDHADLDGWWEQLTNAHRATYESKLHADKYAVLVEAMIENAHDVDPDLAEYTQPEFRSSEEAMKRGYFRIASELNRLPLSTRREIGRRVFEKAELSAKSSQPRYFVAVEPGGRTALAFMVSHLPREDWSQRVMVILKTGMARLGLTHGVGVALNDPSLSGHAFNFVWLELAEPPGPEMLDLADILLGEQTIISFNDFPALEHQNRGARPED